ncbi:hypothetical protein GQX73_g1528 [Xylaria multiplex]|uniref:Zn(2)-C6 fungal-type domain-containing protein n=1 Tax=Xylaria multiplex TaxID=323545 RepID=A0A7C8MRR2_9PEZI|nr:hypothetical protein GQX73_g1528 [Xylaria multiplex]
MVYCGKPSRGCQMCRTRRIKCDETKPTCNQCAKSRRQCPGYMDDFDLMFRNETKATERRAQRANKKALAQKAEKQDSPLNDASSTSSSSTASSSSPVSVKTPSSWVATSPGFSIEEQARCHFISHFILMPKDGRTVGHMDFVLPLLKQEGPDSHIQHAFNACALTTNAALQNKESQQSDASLAAVLLLGMFENISAKQISSFNWGSHIDGAVQLVKARGRKQTKTRVGKQLFIAVRTLMSVYCLTASEAPAMGAEWWLEDTVFSKTAVVIQRLMIKTSELRAQITQIIDTLTKTPENIELMHDIIRKAKAIDQEVFAWQEKQTKSEEWNYRTVVPWEDSVVNGDYARSEVFPGRVDVYNDIWIGSVANSARTVRLILHSAIVRCTAWVCSPADYRTTPEYANAARVCGNAITDIIASVPYFLGWHLKRKDISDNTNFGTFACGEEDSAKGLAGYLVTWPLTCVISQDYATDAQRAWVLGRLRMIGSDLGVRYALAMSQLQMRVPSMMIQRDTYTISHRAMVGHGFEKLVAARLAPRSAGYALNPQQQWEAMQKMKADEGKAKLMEKLTKNATDDGAQRAAQRWLRL